MPDGTKLVDCYVTRTKDGFVFLNAREPEIDNDIVEIIHK